MQIAGAHPRKLHDPSQLGQLHVVEVQSLLHLLIIVYMPNVMRAMNQHDWFVTIHLEDAYFNTDSSSASMEVE